MGCSCIARDDQNLQLKYFAPFEKSLGLQTISSKKIDFTIYRFSTKGLLSIDQLDLACKSLKVPLQGFLDFYSHFLEDGFYSARKLSLLGILLGKGKREVKYGILFDNFDYDLSNQLDSGEIEIMIKDVISICCEFEPSFILSKNSGDKDLKKYLIKMKKSKTSIVEYYLSKILNQDCQISKEEFIQKFNLDDFTLVSPSRIREDCLRILRNEAKLLDHYNKV